MSEQKRCWRCREVKPTSEFYRNRSTKDGYRSDCKTCSSLEQREKRQRRREREGSDYVRRGSRGNVERTVQRVLEWRRLNPEKVLAHKAIYRAVKRGDLVRPERCEECGWAEPKIQAHHDDYADQLNVRWLCARCHGLLHHAERQLEKGIAS